VGLPDFADAIFEDENHDSEEGEPTEKTLTFEDFMSVVLDLRGTNNATVRDIVDLRKHINARFNTFEKRLMDLELHGNPTSKMRSLPRNNSSASLQSACPASQPGSTSIASSLEPARSLEDARRLKCLIDGSLKEFMDLQQAEVSRLLADNRCLQAELSEFQAKQAEFSKFAHLEPLRSVAQAACEDAITAPSEDNKVASLAVVSSEVSSKLQVSIIEPQCMDPTARPDGFGCNNPAATLVTSTSLECSSGWATPAQQCLRKQPPEGAASKVGPLASILEAARCNGRVQPCSCPVLQQPVNKLHATGIPTEAPQDAVDQATQIAKYTL